MYLNERYSEEDAKNVRELVEMTTEQYGIEKTMDILKKTQDDKNFWEKYDEDRKKEKMGELVYSDDEEENRLISAFVKAISKPKTEKMDDDQEGYLREVSAELQKIWTIVSNDEEIKEIVAEEIDNLDYDLEDIDSRMKTVKSILSVLRIIPSKNFEKVYDSLNAKIKEMNFNDFIITLVTSGSMRFCSTEKFNETILNKISNMSNSEFIYFLKATGDGMDGRNEKIIEAKRKKAEACDDLAVSEEYSLWHGSKNSNISKNIEKIDKVLLLKLGIEDEEKQLDIYSKLTDTEFIRFLLNYNNSYRSINPILINNEITTQKLKEISQDNLILLTEAFAGEYINYLNVKDDEENSDLYARGANWEKIILEAKQRKIISEKFDKLYPEDKTKTAKDKIKIYKEINYSSYLPGEKVRFECDIKQDDSDIDDRSTDEILLQRFKDANIKIENLLKTYESIDKMFSMKDIEILQECNKFNIKYNKDKISDNSSRTQSYLLNYFKKRILSMPTGYASFFQMIDGGCLNDVLQLKVEELQHLLAKNEGNKFNSLNK